MLLCSFNYQRVINVHQRSPDFSGYLLRFIFHFSFSIFHLLFARPPNPESRSQYMERRNRSRPKAVNVTISRHRKLSPFLVAVRFIGSRVQSGLQPSKLNIQLINVNAFKPSGPSDSLVITSDKNCGNRCWGQRFDRRMVPRATTSFCTS